MKKIKKQYIIGSVAVIALSLCSYELGRYQSQTTSKQSNRVAYIDGKDRQKTSKNAQKTENLTPDQVSEKEGIHAEQIVVKITDQGYVTSHGDHFHYYNGKVPYDAIISEELVMRDPSYVLQQSDIVNEVKDGYIIKVNGKYYLYLKDAGHTSNVRTKEEIARQREEHGRATGERTQLTSAQKAAVKEAKAQGRYTTDDGYVFSPTDVIEDTGDAFIVPHGSHFHYIPKADLSPAELAAAQAYIDGKNHGNQARPAQPVQPRLSEGTNYLAAAVTPATSQPASQPASQPHQPAVAQPALQSENPVPAGASSMESLLQLLYSTPLSQRHVESDGLIFDPAMIVRRSENGVAVRHGDHYHFIYFNQLSPLEERIARTISIGHKYEVPTGPAVITPQPTPAPQHHHDEEANHDQEEGDHGFHADHVIGKDDTGYMVSHGDHAHYFFKKDLTKEQIAAAEETLKKQAIKVEAPQLDKGVEVFSRDASDEEKRAYISKTYGVPLEAIRISNGFFVFNNPDQAYDPTHIHPYAVRKEHVRIPLVTGDDELDFLNELYTTALRSGVSPYNLQVENGSFVIPHGDHNHYIKVQSKGLATALKHKIPALQASYQAGAYDEKAVVAQVNKLLAESQQLYRQNPLEQRRIELALGQFVENMKALPSNSTAGYLAALDNFDKQYIHIDKTAKPAEVSALDKKYQDLVAMLNTLYTESYGYAKKDLLSQLQAAQTAKDEQALDKLHKQLQALEDFTKRRNIVATDYLRYFYEHIDDSRLSPELRDKVGHLMLALYKEQAFISTEDVNSLFPEIYQTKLELDSLLATGTASTNPDKSLLETETIDGQEAKVAIHAFLSGIYGNFAPAPKEKSNKEEVQTFLDKAAELLQKVTDETAKESFQENLDSLKLSLQAENADTDILYEQAKELLENISANLTADEHPVDPVYQATYEKLYPVISALHKKLEDAKASDQEFAKVDAFFDRLAQPDSDKTALLKDILAFQDQTRAGKKNSEIAYTAEEVALAKSLGHYTTSDGYIFDPHDITSDEGDAYVTPHMGHSHYIPKADLSEAERQAAEEYVKTLSKKTAPDKDSSATLALFNAVTPAKIVPVDKMPYNTAYVVEERNGILIIPHYDHYHNINLTWFDDGLYSAPAGYSLSDLLATIKYYLVHPEERPQSDDGFGDASGHAAPDKEEPAYKPVEEESLEKEEPTEPKAEEASPEETVTVEQVQQELNKAKQLLAKLESSDRKGEFEETLAGLQSSLQLGTQTRTDLFTQVQKVSQELAKLVETRGASN